MLVPIEVFSQSRSALTAMAWALALRLELVAWVAVDWVPRLSVLGRQFPKRIYPELNQLTDGVNLISSEHFGPPNPGRIRPLDGRGSWLG